MAPVLSEAPWCHNGPSVPLGLMVSQCLIGSVRPNDDKVASWFHEDPWCHNAQFALLGLMVSQWDIGSMRQYLVSQWTLGSLRPHGNCLLILLGFLVSQWPLTSMRPNGITVVLWFYEVPIVPYWALGSVSSHSVTMAPCIPRVLQCHNHHRITKAGKEL